jgi:hypothetical protein
MASLWNATRREAPAATKGMKHVMLRKHFEKCAISLHSSRAIMSNF